VQSTTSETRLSPDQVLSAAELERLTLWKWRYSFEAFDFTREQASELTLLTWLRAMGRC
jgi:hypothetical protein